MLKAFASCCYYGGKNLTKNWILFYMLSTYIQIIIQNLSTYTMYTVNVQAASLSVINPRRILLGLHSASRKVSKRKNIYRALCYQLEYVSRACLYEGTQEKH